MAMNDQEDLLKSQSPESKSDSMIKESYCNFDLKIQDFGRGIAPEKIKSLFINFSKVNESHLENKSGVGLGLSICKSLIERMAGSVKVESELGHGTTFTINFRTSFKIDELSSKFSSFSPTNTKQRLHSNEHKKN